MAVPSFVKVQKVFPFDSKASKAAFQENTQAIALTKSNKEIFSYALNGKALKDSGGTARTMVTA